MLVVEDHEDTREIYAWCMRAAGWTVDAVSNGVDALVKAAETEPDVIVMDLHLPVMDGLETTQRLKADERTAHIPVVACTAYGTLYSRSDVEDACFEKVVAKPCSAEELRDIVESIAIQSQ